MEIQIRPRNEQTKVKHWYGTFYPGNGYWRIDSEADSPERVIEYRKQIGNRIIFKSTTILAPEKILIIGGGFGGIQTYLKGHYKYDALWCFYNALEDWNMKFLSQGTWENLILWYRGWIKKDKPALNKAQAQSVIDIEKYLPKF